MNAGAVAQGFVFAIYLLATQSGMPIAASRPERRPQPAWTLTTHFLPRRT